MNVAIERAGKGGVSVKVTVKPVTEGLLGMRY